jgi:hypothetical protein
MNRTFFSLLTLMIFAGSSCTKDKNNSTGSNGTDLQGTWDLVLIKGTIAGGSHTAGSTTTLKIKPGISLVKMANGTSTFYSFSTQRDSSITYGRNMDFFVLNGQKSNMYYFTGDSLVLEADGISDAAYEYYVKE